MRRNQSKGRSTSRGGSNKRDKSPIRGANPKLARALSRQKSLKSRISNANPLVDTPGGTGPPANTSEGKTSAIPQLDTSEDSGGFGRLTEYERSVVGSIVSKWSRTIEAFRAIDSNKDGHITFREFHRGLSESLGADVVTPEVTHNIWKLIDTENTGVITYKDFKRTFSIFAKDFKNFKQGNKPSREDELKSTIYAVQKMSPRSFHLEKAKLFIQFKNTLQELESTKESLEGALLNIAELENKMKADKRIADERFILSRDSHRQTNVKLEKTKKRLQQSEAKKQTLVEDLRKASEVAKSIEARSKQLQQELKASDVEKAKLKQKLDSERRASDETIKTAEERIKNVEAECKSLKEKFDAEKEKVNAAENEADTLRYHLQMQNEEIVRSDKKLKELEQKAVVAAESLSARIRDLEAISAKHHGEAEKNAKAKDELALELSDAKDELAEARAEIERSLKDHEASKAKLAQAQQAESKLKEELDSLAEKITNQRDTHLQEIKDLKEQLRQAKEDAANGSSQQAIKEAAEKKEAELNAQVTKAFREFQVLKTAYDKLKTQHDATSKLVKAYEDQLKQRATEIEEQGTKITLLEKATEAHADKERDLEAKLRAYAGDLAEKDEALQTLEGNHAKASEELEILKSSTSYAEMKLREKEKEAFEVKALMDRQIAQAKDESTKKTADLTAAMRSADEKIAAFRTELRNLQVLLKSTEKSRDDFESRARTAEEKVERHVDRAARVEKELSDTLVRVVELKSQLSQSEDASKSQILAAKNRVSDLREEVQSLRESLGGMEASRGDLKKRAIFAEKKCEKTEAELQIANGTLEVLERRTKTMLSQIDLLESRALTAEKKSEASARHLSDLESRLADTELRVKEKSVDVLSQSVSFSM
uniref:EF-hand domain-containing protein n=1 Tax=Lotharella globosa TaxID=91324 RepID=A0A7S3Z471_9EUKA